MKRRTLSIFGAMLLVLVLAVSLSACGSKTTTTTAPATTDTTAATTDASASGTVTTGAAATGADIPVGAINSMTGSNVLTGQEEKWAQEKAVADINAKGGVKFSDGSTHKLVLKYADDKSDPTAGAAAMEQLIKVDGIKLILSGNITPVNQAAAQVAEKYGVYFDITSSWIDNSSPDGKNPGFIGGMNLKWSTDFFEAAATSGNAAVGAIKNMNAADTPKNFAVMTDNTPDGTGFGNGTEAGMKAAGYNVVTYQQFSGTGTPDFSSIILKFKQLNVDGIVCLIDPASGITFVKQMKEANWAPKYLFGYKGFWPVDFYKALGKDAEFIGHDGFWSELLPFPGSKELGAAFSADHAGATSNSVGLYYAAVQILGMAIEKAGSADPGAVRDKVFGGTFTGTTMGDITFGSIYKDRPGIAHIPLLGFQWQNAARQIVAPPEFATAKMLTFAPWASR